MTVFLFMEWQLSVYMLLCTGQHGAAGRHKRGAAPQDLCAVSSLAASTVAFKQHEARATVPCCGSRTTVVQQAAATEALWCQVAAPRREKAAVSKTLQQESGASNKHLATLPCCGDRASVVQQAADIEALRCEVAALRQPLPWPHLGLPSPPLQVQPITFAL